MSSGGVMPKNSLGSLGPIVWNATDATNQPMNALDSIIPSMPMLTTPERSFSTPHRAPRVSGAASAMMIGPFETTTAPR